MSIRPIVVRPPDPSSSEQPAAGLNVIDLALNAIFACVCVMVAFVSVLTAYHIYLQEFESRTPSGQVYIDSGGVRVYLVQPTAVILPLPLSSNGDADKPLERFDTSTRPSESDAVLSEIVPRDPLPTPVAADPRAVAPPPRDDVPLPPIGLRAPAIALDVPVRIVAIDLLPEEQYAGWLFRSAFPATAGNVVLLGHVDGKAAIFDRLGELIAGDELHVMTAVGTHVYTVEWTAIVDSSAVEVLGPIEHPVLTLITCFGMWDADRRQYDERMVVRARYVAAEDRVASN